MEEQRRETFGHSLVIGVIHRQRLGIWFPFGMIEFEPSIRSPYYAQAFQVKRRHYFCSSGRWLTIIRCKHLLTAMTACIR